MTCGCSGNETSQLLMNGGAKKRTRTTKPKKSVKRTTSTKKRTATKKRTMRGGGDEHELLNGTKIPLRVQSSPDWVSSSDKTSSPPYAIDLGEAMQSYLFGRPTPNGKDFMVASGFVEQSKGIIDMVGGKKKRTTKKRTTKKRTTKKRTTKKRTTKK